MVRSFTRAMQKWLTQYTKTGDENLLYLTSFDFNSETTLAERFKVKLQVVKAGMNKAELLIPAFNPILAIAPKAGATAVKLKVQAASVMLNGSRPHDCTYTEITIPYNDTEVEAQALPMPSQAPAGSLVLVVVVMEYIIANSRNRYTVTAKAFMPFGVVGGYVC
jgi:hypothetical protein